MNITITQSRHHNHHASVITITMPTHAHARLPRPTLHPPTRSPPSPCGDWSLHHVLQLQYSHTDAILGILTHRRTRACSVVITTRAATQARVHQQALELDKLWLCL